MADISYISNFLTKVEGPRQTVGYIPCFIKGGGTANYKGGANPDRYTAMGASGVTIATGCDLGQTDIESLRGYGIHSIALLDKLLPYIGLKKHSAIAALHRHPLEITVEQAEMLDHAVHGGYLLRYVKPAYDRASTVKFDDLPPQGQAMIMSICFQKGVGGTKRDYPQLWSHLVKGDWRAAARILANDSSQYRTRRRIEGKLLEELP